MTKDEIQKLVKESKKKLDADEKSSAESIRGDLSSFKKKALDSV